MDTQYIKVDDADKRKKIHSARNTQTQIIFI